MNQIIANFVGLAMNFRPIWRGIDRINTGMIYPSRSGEMGR